MIADATGLRRQRLDDVRLRGAVAGSAAPAVQNFEAARTASEQRQAKSLAAADIVLTSGAAELKRGGHRMFKKEGDRWIDVGMKDGLRVYKVKAYSRSYFTLLERIAELREAFAAGDKVLVAGKSVAIEVVEDAPELSEGQMREIVGRW
jgi:hypothetical protein